MLGLLVLIASRASAVEPAAYYAPAVVGIAGEFGLNVLHQDFALAPGATLPSEFPVDEIIPLPATGTFEERLAAARSSTLGALPQGKLFWVEGTRILLRAVAPPQFPNERVDVLEERFHGTGVASAAIGRRHGTNPEGWAVFVIGTPQEQAFGWLSTQPWIDVVSESAYTPLDCRQAPAIRAMTSQGRTVFGASGNAEQAGIASGPHGLPEVYQVGGVDESGRTHALPSPENPEPSVTPTRPYETGDRFNFPAAHESSLDGTTRFGGTSGAAPSTAGRASRLITLARELLSDSSAGVSGGVIAEASAGADVPPSGPLSDGQLVRSELVDVLHRTAQPAESDPRVRYLIEGYGAFNDEAEQLARAVLRGEAPLPERLDEDAMHAQVEQHRATLFTGRCG